MHFAVLIVTNIHSKLFFSSLSTWYLALSWKTPKWDFLFAHFILCSRFFLNRLYSQLYSFFSIPITSHVCLLKSLQWFTVFELPDASLRSACMPFTNSQLLSHCGHSSCPVLPSEKAEEGEKEHSREGRILGEANVLEIRGHFYRGKRIPQSPQEITKFGLW